MKDLLKQVINNEVNSVKIPFTPIKKIEILLNELGVNTNKIDLDTNGWEIDFCYKYENKYQLSGSLHYGDFVFSKL